jgi:ribose transport system substrate-binding protein
LLFQQIQKAKWINRKQNRLSIVLCCLLTCFCGSSFAEIVIGVVGKTKNDSFYEQSFKGCEEFAKDYKDVRCIYDGPQDYQDIRSQTIIVNELVEKEINGLLISTTDSEFLVKGALSSMHIGKIPVITFDSDLLPKHEMYRLAYVGTNNFNFGEALGNYVKQFGQSELNSICLQSGHPTTPNLNERIAGIRYALSGQNDERLSGQNGWIEYARCPLYSLGKRELALKQLEGISNMKKPPIFLAVAGFAQFSPQYIERTVQFKKRIDSGELVIVSADTEDIQLEALKQGLSVGNIGQKPFEMGRLGAELLYNYITQKQKPAKSHYYLDYHYCKQKNVEGCTVNY